MKAKARITQITMARLYNLGNYEHVRFEVTAEIPKGVSAEKTARELSAIFYRLQPLKKPFNYDHMLEVLNKAPEALSEVDKARLDEYVEAVKEYEGLKALRMAAVARLDNLGGTSKHTDAKDKWDDGEEPPF